MSALILILISAAILFSCACVWCFGSEPPPPASKEPHYGMASWYGEPFRGQPMANGKPFNPDRMTAASWHYPLGAKVRVTYCDRSVGVVITDRGPSATYINRGRIIDLSRAAFARLENPDLGLILVSVEEIQ